MTLRPELRSVRAIYFDLDDTLCTYWDAAKVGLKKAFAAHPEHGMSEADILKHWSVAFSEFVETIGRTHWYEKYLRSGEITRVELMRRTLERVNVFDEDLAERLSQTYHIERQAALDLFPESLIVLRQLQETYPLGLITNGPADIQALEVQSLNLAPYFEHIFIEGELGFGKPDVRVLQLAEEAMGVKGSEILFVGNSYRHDIKPAVDFGWQTAWIRRDSDVPPSSRTGKIEERPESDTPPTVTIFDLRELLEA